MYLQGQHGQRGYAMAALLVALAVMSVMMSAVLPAWRHQARREKEAELVFRGEQYVRAISLWERKMGPGSRPPNFDILVQQKFLRKKYKDPMTPDGEFQPVYAGLNAAGGGRGRGRGAAPGPSPAPAPPAPQVPGQVPGQVGPAGIFGVVSKSTETSIRIYKGRTRYDQWPFVHAGAASAPGGGVGSPMPGGRGAQRPGGRGVSPGDRRGGPGRSAFPQPGGRRGNPSP